MGKPTGFMEFGRAAAAAPARPGAPARLARGLRALRRRAGHQGAGRPLHGLRHPVLPRGLPARQPHPRVERPGLPGRLVRRHRAPARHQQLPRVHRPALPGPVRGGLRPRDQRRPGDHRADRVRDRRAGLGRGLGDPAGADRAHRQVGGRGGLGPGRPGRGPAAGPGRPHGDGVRAGREARRAAALRHPRVQDGEGRARPPAGPDGGRGRHLRLLHVGGRVDAATAATVRPNRARSGASARPAPPTSRVRPAAEVRAEFDAVVLAGGATLPRDLPVPGRALDGRPPRPGVPEALEPGAGGRAGVVARSAPRASGSSSSAAATPEPTAWARRTARAPPRCTSSRSCPSPRATAWPTTRGRCGRSSCARPRPTRRAASGSSP